MARVPVWSDHARAVFARLRVRSTLRLLVVGLAAGIALAAALMASAASPSATTRESLRDGLADGEPLSQGNSFSLDSSISDDGRYVAFESFADNLTADAPNDFRNIYVRDRADNSTTLVSLNPGGGRFDGDARAPSISADGNKVAFQAQSRLIPTTTEARAKLDRVVFVESDPGADGADIRMLDEDGTGYRTITNSPNTPKLRPKVSPDGTQIVYEQLEGGATIQSSIWIADVATGTTRQLTTPAAGFDDYTPSWSPDGTRVVFFRTEGDPETDWYLYTINVEDTPALTSAVSETEIADGPMEDTGGFLGFPDWHPNGRSIVFSGHFADEFDLTGVHLYEIDLNNNVTQLSSGVAGVTDTSPSWHPDGGSILFNHQDAGGLTLRILDLTPPGGSGPPTETDVRSDAVDGRWRPDGRRIVFTNTPDDALYTMDPDAPADIPTLLYDVAAAAHWVPRNLAEFTPAYDFARVTSTEPGFRPTGRVRFFLCGPVDGNECEPGEADERQIGAPVLLQPDPDDPDSAIAESPLTSDPAAQGPELFDLTGEYCWRAEYEGGVSHDDSLDHSAPEQCFEVQADYLDFSAAADPSTEVEPSELISVNAFNPTGQSVGLVTFFLCGPGEIDGLPMDPVDAGGCSEGGLQVFQPDFLHFNGGSGTFVNSDSFGAPDDPGTYCWRAEFADADFHFQRFTNRNEMCFNVVADLVDAGLVADMVGDAIGGNTFPPGQSNIFFVTIGEEDGPDPTPTGDVTFFLCGPDEVSTAGCLTGGTQVGDADTLTDGGNGLATAASTSSNDTTQEGTYCWRAEYAGDDEYAPNEVTSSECFRVQRNWVPSPGTRVDVYLRDIAAGTTTAVSVAPGGTPADGNSFAPSISADGLHVAFESDAANLAPDVGYDPTRNVFLRDLAAGTTELVSVHLPCDAIESACFTSGSDQPSVSADGTFVAFSSGSAELDAFYPDGTRYEDPFANDGPVQVYVRNIGAGRTTLQSVDARPGPCAEDAFGFSFELEGRCPGLGFSDQPSISGDASRIAYRSDADNLLPPGQDSNGQLDIYLRDRTAQVTRRVSVDSAGGEADNLSGEPAISGDGRSVAFASAAANLVEDDGNAGDCETADCQDVFLHDTVTRVTDRVSESTSGLEASQLGDPADSRRPAVSVNARYISFDSDADNLVTLDTNQAVDVFVHDRIPVLRLTPDPRTFGNVPVGEDSVPRTVTATNVGNGPLEIATSVIGGTNAGDFTVVSDLCVDATLFAGESCTFRIVFNPGALGTRNGSFTATGVTVTGAPPSRTIRMVGTGTTPVVRELALTPSPMAFGQQRVGTTSGPQVLTATSVGDGAVTIDEVRIGGGDRTAFRLLQPGGDTCTGAVLDPGENCQFVVLFQPVVSGLHRARVVFTDDAIGSPQRVPMSGRGIQAVVVITPDPVDFGFGAPRRRGEDRIATVVNTGNAPVTLSTVRLAGPGRAAFEIVADGCGGVVLVPGDGGCAVQLRFMPPVPGRHRAAIRVDAEDGAEGARARLRGTAPRLRISPPLSRRGFVPQITGRFFPPRKRLVLEWKPGIGRLVISTTRNGTFRTGLLVMKRDALGRRELVVRRLGFPLSRRFLVVPGSLQPPEFNARY